MFEEFEKSSSKENRGRQGASAILSIGIFGGIALLVGGAVTAHQVHKHRQEREQEVTFADMPTVKAPKPKALVKAGSVKKAAKRLTPVVNLKEIPEDRPVEAEGELAGGAEDTGAVDGVLEETVAKPVVAAAPPPPAPVVRDEPVAPPPEQQRETIEAPEFVSGCRAPETPEALLSNAATIRIEVQMMIDTSGKVVSAKVIQSHPMIPDQVVLRCALTQVFTPAHLPDGTAVPYPYKRRFVFKPAQA